MSDSVVRNTALTLSNERPAATFSGYILLLIMLLSIVSGIYGATVIRGNPVHGGAMLAVSFILFFFILCGFYMQQPNQATAITLFGSYKGTDRNTGLRWLFPWLGR